MVSFGITLMILIMAEIPSNNFFGDIFQGEIVITPEQIRILESRCSTIIDALPGEIRFGGRFFSRGEQEESFLQENFAGGFVTGVQGSGNRTFPNPYQNIMFRKGYDFGVLASSEGSVTSYE